MTRTQTLTWFARHEMTLAWRDWAAMMAGGRTTRERAVTLFVLLFVLGLHWLAYAILKPVFERGVVLDQPAVIVLTATLLTTFSMMLSQSIEHVTRAFYARADLDLILSSPAPSQHVFAIRIAALAATGVAMTALLAAPIINTAVLIDGPSWLSAYVLIAAMGALATSIALAVAMTMFRLYRAQANAPHRADLCRRHRRGAADRLAGLRRSGLRQSISHGRPAVARSHGHGTGCG